MKYEMNDLITIAERSVNYQRGMGDAALAHNSESWAPYLRFLGLVVKQYAPQVCLELGVYMGTATMHMALGSASTMVVGVDRDFHPSAGGNLSRFPNVTTVYGDTTNPLTKGTVKGLLEDKPVGLLFIDSTHDGVTPNLEYRLYQDLFAEECLVVCDDLLAPDHLKAMQDFWEWLPGEKQILHYLHPRLNKDYPVPGFGISIVRRGDA